MKIFQYPMESILNYRKNIEEEKKQLFSETQKKYLIQQDILGELKHKLNNNNTSLIKDSPKEVVELKKLERYRSFLQEKIEKQEQLLLEIEEDLEAKKNHMKEAQKDRKIIEKHKENSFCNYMFDANKQEQKMIDEFAVSSYFRK